MGVGRDLPGREVLRRAFGLALGLLACAAPCAQAQSLAAEEPAPRAAALEQGTATLGQGAAAPGLGAAASELDAAVSGEDSRSAGGEPALPDAGADLFPGRPLRRLPPASSADALLPALHRHADSLVFSLDLPAHPAVERRLESYLARGKDLEAALARMARYRRFVDSSIRELGLPPELLVLPLLESRYSARAVSRSGASGLWQIMGNTSGALGLRSDEWLDERRDFWKATRAALRKLEDNRRQFGDWLLALAAYNCGSGCMGRLLASSGARDFWELRERGLLRRETAEYVPAFIALSRIVGSPARYGLQAGWDASPAWERVRVTRSVDLRLLARALGLDFAVLREANAELKYPVTPPYGEGWWLKVPAGLGARVSELLADPASRLLEFQFHRLASGETLYGLARRYGVALPLIEQANAELDPRRLPVGGIVRIPVVDRRAAAPAPGARGGSAGQAGPAVSGGLAAQEGRAAQAGVGAAGAASGVSYTVVSGDTLWAIARRHRVSVEALAAANGRSLDDPLKPGDTLKVPAEGQ